MDEHSLDGNAIAGALHQHLGRELTTARATCGHCGATFVLAELVVYSGAMGSVCRCRHCDGVVLVIVEHDETIQIHWNRFALTESPAPQR
jgi:Family of unknown function (DUF6510)